MFDSLDDLMSDDILVLAESLESRIDNFYKMCQIACEKSDKKLFKRAIRQVHIIEEILWKLYMEVYYK